jgi:hypothetical protein
MDKARVRPGIARAIKLLRLLGRRRQLPEDWNPTRTGEMDTGQIDELMTRRTRLLVHLPVSQANSG